MEQITGSVFEQLQGAHGGTMALMFGCGCVCGYAAAAHTTLKQARERISELKTELDAERAARKTAISDLMNELRGTRQS